MKPLYGLLLALAPNMFGHLAVVPPRPRVLGAPPVEPVRPLTGWIHLGSGPQEAARSRRVRVCRRPKGERAARRGRRWQRRRARERGAL